RSFAVSNQPTSWWERPQPQSKSSGMSEAQAKFAEPRMDDTANFQRLSANVTGETHVAPTVRVQRRVHSSVDSRIHMRPCQLGVWVLVGGLILLLADSSFAQQPSSQQAALTPAVAADGVQPSPTPLSCASKP